MKITTILPFLFCLFISFANAQKNPGATFGEPSQGEFLLEVYPPDPDAPGVILYERGNFTVDAADGYIRLIKEVHRKIKIFDAKNFDYSSFEIPYYHTTEVSENIKNFQAITHNGNRKAYVGKNAIFHTEEDKNHSTMRFTFPDVQDGSILEYTYRLETPYMLRLGGWQFMHPLPTLYSELHTEIPGNYRYNRTLYGSRKLNSEHAEILKSCFHLPGFKVPGDCESATYVMKNVPAFKEENYMLSKHNYISTLKFELRDIVQIDESREFFAKTWDDVDRYFKTDKDLGRQLKYTNFFKDQLPQEIETISNKLERAKAIYYYIQDQMFWNKQFRIFDDVRVKEAFERKSGNSSEINLALINALEAAGLEAKIMLIATRDKAMPTKQYPVLTDFNYALAVLTVDGKKYLLDATEKYTPFGVLPFRDLNLEGRVLDFKNGSYWEPISPIAQNVHYLNLQLHADENGIFKGTAQEISSGYIGAKKRKTYLNLNTEDQVKKKQEQNEHLEVSQYNIENQKDLEHPFKESFSFEYFDQQVAQSLYLNPFITATYFSENPFTAPDRQYPIDFGFPINNNYLVSIDLGDQYEIISLPENKLLRLPENDGSLSVVYSVSGNKVNIRLALKLNRTHFPAEAYKSLQEFFITLTQIQNESPIKLKKI